jgi:hypothetical protein
MSLPGTAKAPVSEKVRSISFATLGEELPSDYKITIIEDLSALQKKIESEETNKEVAALKIALSKEMADLQHGCLAPGEAESLRSHLRELIGRKSGEMPVWMKLLADSLEVLPDEEADEEMINGLLK